MTAKSYGNATLYARACKTRQGKNELTWRQIDLNNYFIEFQLLEHIDKTGNPRL
jgi:hypothetical protein